MALFKITYIFEGPSKGWTESFTLNGTGADHTKQVPAVVTLAKARAKLLASPCFIKGYRISLDGTGPDALLSYDRFNPETVTLPSGSVVGLDDAADPDQALLIRCSNGTMSKHKFIFLRGIPDNCEVMFGKYDKKIIWSGLMREYIRALTSGPWGWMGVDDAASKKKIPVINVEEGPKGNTTFTFKKDIFPVGIDPTKPAKIRISGVNKKSPANGVHLVYPLGTDGAVTVNALAPGKYYFGGRGSYTPLTFVPIENAEDQKIVTRETGAPLLQSRGRAPARARG